MGRMLRPEEIFQIFQIFENFGNFENLKMFEICGNFGNFEKKMRFFGNLKKEILFFFKILKISKKLRFLKMLKKISGNALWIARRTKTDFAIPWKCLKIKRLRLRLVAKRLRLCH